MADASVLGPPPRDGHRPSEFASTASSRPQCRAGSQRRQRLRPLRCKLVWPAPAGICANAPGAATGKQAQRQTQRRAAKNRLGSRLRGQRRQRAREREETRPGLNALLPDEVPLEPPHDPDETVPIPFTRPCSMARPDIPPGLRCVVHALNRTIIIACVKDAGCALN